MIPVFKRKQKAEPASLPTSLNNHTKLLQSSNIRAGDLVTHSLADPASQMLHHRIDLHPVCIFQKVPPHLQRIDSIVKDQIRVRRKNKLICWLWIVEMSFFIAQQTHIVSSRVMAWTIQLVIWFLNNYWPLFRCQPEHQMSCEKNTNIKWASFNIMLSASYYYMKHWLWLTVTVPKV